MRKPQAGQHRRAVIGALGHAISFVPLMRETLTLQIKLLICMFPISLPLIMPCYSHPIHFPPVNAGRKSLEVKKMNDFA